MVQTQLMIIVWFHHMKKLLDDIVAEVNLRSLEAEQVILMGYSFGAALMLLAAYRLQSDDAFKARVVGFIGISTAFDVGHNVPAWQLSLSSVIAPISRLLFYKFRPMSNFLTIREMDVSLISADPVLQESIRRDKLVYKGRIPLNTSVQVYKASQSAKACVNNVAFPVLLLHSSDDQIALAPEPADFKQHVKIRLFKNLRHNCIDGLQREAVVARKAITEFIAKKL